MTFDTPLFCQSSHEATTTFPEYRVRADTGAVQDFCRKVSELSKGSANRLESSSLGFAFFLATVTSPHIIRYGQQRDPPVRGAGYEPSGNDYRESSTGESRGLSRGSRVFVTWTHETILRLRDFSVTNEGSRTIIRVRSKANAYIFERIDDNDNGRIEDLYSSLIRHVAGTTLHSYDR